jgi:hypothetical protein
MNVELGCVKVEFSRTFRLAIGTNPSRFRRAALSGRAREDPAW